MAEEQLTKKAQEMVDKFPEETQHGILRYVLKTRKSFVYISMNGASVAWKRSVLRDYLRKKYPDVKNDAGGE